MFLRLFGLSVAVPAIVFTSLAAAAAQFSEDAGFVPVTDAMLRGSGGGRLADVAPHAERLGLQPASARKALPFLGFYPR